MRNLRAVYDFVGALGWRIAQAIYTALTTARQDAARGPRTGGGE